MGWTLFYNFISNLKFSCMTADAFYNYIYYFSYNFNNFFDLIVELASTKFQNEPGSHSNRRKDA